jgi:excisionase family DNA binding protein
MSNLVNYVPVRTAARILKVSKARIYQMISEHKFKFVNFDGVYLIEQSDLERHYVARMYKLRRVNESIDYEGEVLLV